MRKVYALDSHTGGEPTRIVISGGPDLGTGTLHERRERFRLEHDAFRSAVVNEPRGSDVLVGGILCPPILPDSTAGIIFFNNVSTLGMCGHGTIGLVVTLAHLGQISVGNHRIETPVGVVEVGWKGGNEVSVVNVASFRKVKDLTVEVPGVGTVKGDIAWGGNWFYLVKDPSPTLAKDRCADLTMQAQKIRDAVNAAGHPEVDHVEFFGPPQNGGNSRNFVLCPGGAYDRSPCGTGTSAKLACLAADGVLEEGAVWVQESIIGSSFRGTFQWIDREKGIIAPVISGTAYVTGENVLFLDEQDPLCWGIR